MTLIRTALAAILLLFLAAELHAQIGISLSSPRANYLLYESEPFIVKVTNETSDPITLSSDESKSKSWLSFIILRVDGSKIRAEAPMAVKDQTLEPGASCSVTVNVTPHYALRETGQYTIQAVVHPDSMDSYITSKLTYNVSKGETIWQRDRMVDNRRTTYSLIRFLEDNTSCYVRVEEQEDNLVLSTVRMGSLMANSVPTAIFDDNGELHVLQCLAASSYRYSRISEDGRIEFQEDRLTGGSVPMLTKDNGMVQFSGGMTQKEQDAAMHRPSLAEDQGGKLLGTADAPFRAPAGYAPFTAPNGSAPSGGASLPPLPKK